MTTEPTVTAHRNKQARRAIVLLFGSETDEAATRYAWLLSHASSLNSWDVYVVSLPTLSFNQVGILSGEPNLALLARTFGQIVTRPPFDRYGQLALLAHSLGGLLVQRALLSETALVERVSHVVLYATPSAGLERASPFQFWKRQVRDLTPHSPFIIALREEWNARFSEHPPFSLTVVAGDRDEFVPPTSSLGPFPEMTRRVVPGTHRTLAHPASPEDMGFQLTVAVLSNQRADPNELELARLDVEARRFQQAVDSLWPRRAELSESDLVTLALALDSIDRREDAIAVLGSASGTDAMGVLAGRHKRRWLQQRRSADADRALSLYTEALDRAEATSDEDQALYAAINCAFMALAYQGDSTACRSYAERALAHCNSAKPSLWSNATRGEANIYLGNPTAARDAYTSAIALKPSPREFDSMYEQALRAADLTGDDELAGELATLLQHGPGQPTPDVLYLESIDLENIRCFASLTVNFNHSGELRKHAAILGDNARGKSTLLRAITIGVCSATDAVTLMKSMSGPLIREGEQQGRIAVHLLAQPSGRRLTLEKRIGKAPDGSETLHEPSQQTEFPWESLFVCGYGTQRTAMATASFETYSPRLAVATLFDPSAVLQNPEVALLRQPPTLRRQLQKKLLDVMLLESNDVGIEESNQGLLLRGPFGASPFAVLSDGYRSTAQWLMDLFAWMVLARRLPAAEEPGGILLIDEIEQHLHPRWQRHIVQRLAAQLPNMQIIVTTHTPLVASGLADLDAACLVRFSAGRDSRTEVEHIDPKRLHGKRADQVLADVFELITTRNPGSNHDLDELARLRSLTTRTHDEERELARLEASLREGLDFSQNDVERKVRSAISGTLDKMLQESPVEPFDEETKRQLRDLLGV